MSWRDSAACLGIPHLFFAAAGDDELRGINNYDAAREICVTCPVQPECLDYAIEHNLKDGIWGGLDDKERRSEKNRRRNAKRKEYLHTYYIDKRKAS